MSVSKRFDKFVGCLGIAIAVGFSTWIVDSGIRAQTGGRTFYVDIKNASCADTPGNGSESKPYCSLRYVSTIAAPGDTFLIKAGRYGNGPAAFTKSGSATAPITYKAIGDVVMGIFDDVPDEEFQPTQFPDVYSINRTSRAVRGYRIHQTYFDPILVDDPGNPSIFTMRQEDGPLALSKVSDLATLSKIEGTWLFDATAGKVYIHAYDNRAPGTASTDFVFGDADYSLSVTAPVQFNVFAGFRITYSGPFPFFVGGSNNRFLNIKFQGAPWSLGGNNNYAENITLTHVIARGPTWLWHTGGAGSGIGVGGTGHKLRNLHIYHNWNSSISTQNARGVVIDGLRSHGAPNHCGSGAYSNNIVRNVIQYNCQDYFYLHEMGNVVIEHAVSPNGIALQAINAPMGPITVRNSILGSGLGFTSVSRAITCAWEAGSVFENNIIPSDATIQHCEDNRRYTFADYISKCESGVLTNCMRVKGTILVPDLKAVIKDGRWNGALGDKWDVTLVPSSAAIDRGTVTGTATDILGVLRPQGTAPDIGAHEFCARGCLTTFPIETTSGFPRQSSAPSNLRIVQ